jgi:hypothetical protein
MAEQTCVSCGNDLTNRSGESAANPSAAPSAAQSYHYPTGRAINDGGFVMQQSGANSAQGAARNSSAPIERAQAQGADNRRSYDYAGANFAGPMRSGASSACAARFRSFDPTTGTYMGFDGSRHRCP